MLQLHLACEQRIGVIIVGPAGSGKSTLWGLLRAAYAHLGRPPQVYTVNPKALPRAQLLGSMNLDTREWSDGVLTAAARKVSCLAWGLPLGHTALASGRSASGGACVISCQCVLSAAPVLDSSSSWAGHRTGRCTRNL